MGDFSLPAINWGHHTAGTIWTRSFLKHLDNNFMEQVLRKLTRKDVLLDLLLRNGVDFGSQVDIGAVLASDYEVSSLKSLLTGRPQLWT